MKITIEFQRGRRMLSPVELAHEVRLLSMEAEFLESLVKNMDKMLNKLESKDLNVTTTE